ncbi:MAG: Flp family type IVb pilin [Rhodospirillales bacterium]|nr:Flp family type IVb pilin [Alphaproteobacteria bacterium]MBL6948205.1 Flp family type IVb pilin [Rhodospirillales bacterium]
MSKVRCASAFSISPRKGTTVKASLRKLINDEKGATAIEYALIATLVVVTLIGAFNLLSTDLNNTFNTVANTVTPVI